MNRDGGGAGVEGGKPRDEEPAEDHVTEPSDAPPARRRGRRVLIAVIAAFVVGALVGAGAFFAGRATTADEAAAAGATKATSTPDPTITSNDSGHSDNRDKKLLPTCPDAGRTMFTATLPPAWTPVPDKHQIELYSPHGTYLFVTCFTISIPVVSPEGLALATKKQLLSAGHAAIKVLDQGEIKLGGKPGAFVRYKDKVKKAYTGWNYVVSVNKRIGTNFQITYSAVTPQTYKKDFDDLRKMLKSWTWVKGKST